MPESVEIPPPVTTSSDKPSSRRRFLRDMLASIAGATVTAAGSKISNSEIVREMNAELSRLKGELATLKTLLLTSMRYVDILTHHAIEQNSRMPSCIISAIDPNDPRNKAQIMGLYGPSAQDYNNSPELSRIASEAVASVYPALTGWKIMATDVDHSLPPPEPQPPKPYTPPLREPDYGKA